MVKIFIICFLGASTIFSLAAYGVMFFENLSLKKKYKPLEEKENEVEKDVINENIVSE